MPEALLTNGYVGPVHIEEDEILCVQDLTYRYPDGTLALEDVSLHVRRGATLGVIGPNGSGKTTLLKVILGLLSGYRGSVRVEGIEPQEARRRGDILSWVPQHLKMQWDFPVTIEQVVRMGLAGKTGPLRRYRREDLAYLEQILELLDLQRVRGRRIGEVSGGQRQRAVVARALVPKPRLLLLDEPTVGVDQAGLQTFHELIRQVKQSFDVTMVIVSHDLRTLLPECEKLACLNRRLHFHDAPSRLTDQVLGEVFRCELTGLWAGGERPTDPAHAHDHDNGHDHDHPHPEGRA